MTSLTVWVVLASLWIGGAGLGVASIFKLKQHVDNPAQAPMKDHVENPSNTPLK